MKILQLPIISKLQAFGPDTGGRRQFIAANRLTLTDAGERECAAVDWLRVACIPSLVLVMTLSVFWSGRRQYRWARLRLCSLGSRSPSTEARCSVRFTLLFVVSCAVIMIEHGKAWKQTVCVLVRVHYTISPSREYGPSRDCCIHTPSVCVCVCGDFLGIPSSPSRLSRSSALLVDWTHDLGEWS